MKTEDHHVIVREGFKPGFPWAIFLDRDGVLNEEVHLLRREEDLRLIPTAADAVKKINEHGIPAIMVHNAATVSRGLCSLEQEENLNALLVEKLARQGAHIDALLYCPHHPTALDEKFKKDCAWHKPKPGMLKKAATLFGLDLKKSYLIGDTARDTLAALAVKTFSLLVQTGHGGKDLLFEAKPDRTCTDILDAVNFILRRENLS